MDAIDRFTDLDFDLIDMADEELHEFATAAARQVRRRPGPPAPPKRPGPPPGGKVAA